MGKAVAPVPTAPAKQKKRSARTAAQYTKTGEFSGKLVYPVHTFKGASKPYKKTWMKTPLVESVIRDNHGLLVAKHTHSAKTGEILSGKYIQQGSEHEGYVFKRKSNNDTLRRSKNASTAHHNAIKNSKQIRKIKTEETKSVNVTH
jgi:hypothetical protein